jgi:hypothetical protein
MLPVFAYISFASENRVASRVMLLFIFSAHLDMHDSSLEVRDLEVKSSMQ